MERRFIDDTWWRVAGRYVHCQGVTREGRRCTRWADTGSTYCWTHDPAQALKRRAARAKAQEADTARRARPTEIDAYVTEDVAQGYSPAFRV